MKKWKTALIVAAVAFALYALIFTSPGGQSGSGDTGEEPQEYTAAPVLRLYTWENYWESDTKQARREVEMELGVTYETGNLMQINQKNKSKKQSVTICEYDYSDEFYISGSGKRNGYFSIAYDGRFHVQHSVALQNWLLYGDGVDDPQIYSGNKEVTNGLVTAKNNITVSATCHSPDVVNVWKTKSNKYEGYKETIQYLDESYISIPQDMNHVNREISTVYVTVQALDDADPELIVAEAVVQIRHYEPWKGASLDDLLAAGVPLKDTSYRQEMTLIEYSQREDIAEALS